MGAADSAARQLPLPRSMLASVIHIASTRARQSEPQSEGYAAAKAGLLGLTHAQSGSLAGIARVNAVLPGWIDTADREGGDASAAEAAYSAEVGRDDHDWHWVKRVGLPDDVAQMV